MRGCVCARKCGVCERVCKSIVCVRVCKSVVCESVGCVNMVCVVCVSVGGVCEIECGVCNYGV